MRILLRGYDIEGSDESGATMRALAAALHTQGDDVWATGARHEIAEIRAWRPDVIVAHQWATAEAGGWATLIRCPFVMLVHGPGQYEHFMPQCDLVIFDGEDDRATAAQALGRTPAAVIDMSSDLASVRARLTEVAAAGRRRPTLSVCMTVANEAHTLEQAVESVRHVADEIIIGVDTKSRDETAAIAARIATRCFAFTESSPPDFRRMRNRAMELVDTDWALVLDGHEWIEHADRIPGALETTAWSIEIETLYEPDEQRIPGLAFPFPRIHRRHIRFAGAAAHEEVTTPSDKRDSRPDIKVWHERKPGPAASARNAEKSGAELDLLREAWLTTGDRRALFYLANGLREAGRYDEAIGAYDSYLAAPNFPEEGWQARLYLARCRAALGAWPEAGQEFTEAVIAAPERAEAAVGLGYALLGQGEARKAAAWFRMATGLPQPHGCRMFVEVPVYRWGAWHGLALALDRLGDYGGAADAEAAAAARGAGSWATANVAWWRGRAAGSEAP
jgi:glycosyl transferase family 2/tetratricopeptide repeat protein